jgi:hypothetical protein
VTDEPKQLAFWPGQRFDQRIEVRLDGERRRKLFEIAQARKVSISQAMRDLIDRAYDGEQPPDEARRP